MAWALVAEDNWGVTARLSIDFKRPVPVGSQIRAEGWVVRSRRRLVDTAGQVVDSNGALLAVATAVYVAANEERKRQLMAQYGVRIRNARASGQGISK
ncbi:MAG TPA: hotdog domain-containing protein, partial [Candidatus Limnocylindrales bacterium]